MTNRKTKRQKAVFISVITALALLIFGAVTFMGQGMNAYAMSGYDGQAESRIFSSATIDDDFADDSVLVILRRTSTFP